MKTIAVIDYGLGNLFSVKNALEKVGANVIITNEYELIRSSDAIILPGVGSFKQAMANILSQKIDRVIKEFNNENKPIFGVCLGFQLLFESSSEHDFTRGLGLLPGEVVSIRKFDNKLISPSIGWSKIILKNQNSDSIFRNLSSKYMYFVHSYFVSSTNDYTSSYYEYGSLKIMSSVRKNNLYGTQFHPEKSGKQGLQVYKNFIDNIKKGFK